MLQTADWLSMLLLEVRWVLLALLAPEIVLFTAANESLEAFTLRKQPRELQNRSEIVNKGVGPRTIMTCRER